MSNDMGGGPGKSILTVMAIILLVAVAIMVAIRYFF